MESQRSLDWEGGGGGKEGRGGVREGEKGGEECVCVCVCVCVRERGGGGIEGRREGGTWERERVCVGEGRDGEGTELLKEHMSVGGERDRKEKNRWRFT